MKAHRSILGAALGLLAVACLGLTPAAACPLCNIHNRLHLHIADAKFIVHGKVLRIIDKEAIEIEVVRVLRGQEEPGAKKNLAVYVAAEDVGREFLFCDPSFNGLAFPILPLELEDEIRFLMQKNLTVDHLDEALKRVQGVSITTHRAGLAYIDQHFDEAVKPLLAELERLERKVFSDHPPRYGQHRLEMLARALLHRESEDGTAFVIRQVDALARGEAPEVDWTKPGEVWSARNDFLSELFTHAARHEKTATKVRERLTAVAPKLHARRLVDTAYAAARSELLPIKDLRKAVDDPARDDLLALGLHGAASHASSWWKHQKSLEHWKAALSLVKREDLRVVIAEKFGEAQMVGKR